MKFQIKHTDSPKIIFETEAKTQKECIEKAVKQNVNLSRANLSGAILYGAILYGAILSSADLSSAILSSADLSSANLYGAILSGADLSGANLSGANLYGANLYGADLSGANLYGANLNGAILSSANLYGANLNGAILSRANLDRATQINPIYQSLLCLLQHQKHPITAFKYLDKNMKSPYQGCPYEIGKTYKVARLNNDTRIMCGEGLNVATLEWCLKKTNCRITDYIYVEVEIPAEATKIIPYNSDGKFRVSEFKIIRQLKRGELEAAIKPLY